MQCTVRFPPQWIDLTKFERALQNSCGPHDSDTYQVIFEFPVGCKIMVDAATRLLSLVNQLASTTRSVLLDFHEGDGGTMGYLNRMGFFDHLASDVEIVQGWPVYSAANYHRGGNSSLVEIAHQQGCAR